VSATDLEARVHAAAAELANAIVAMAVAERQPRRAATVELLSVASFAKKTSLGRSTVYLGVADGSIRTVKIRGRRLVPSSELDRLAERAVRKEVAGP